MYYTTKLGIMIPKQQEEKAHFRLICCCLVTLRSFLTNNKEIRKDVVNIFNVNKLCLEVTNYYIPVTTARTI